MSKCFASTQLSRTIQNVSPTNLLSVMAQEKNMWVLVKTLRKIGHAQETCGSGAVCRRPYVPPVRIYRRAVEERNGCATSHSFYGTVVVLQASDALHVYLVL